MKDLITTEQTYTSTFLVIPKSEIVIADKMGAIRNKEGTIVGLHDDNFNVIELNNDESTGGDKTTTSGIVLCGPAELENLGNVNDYV